MENAEEILQLLDEFSKLRPKEIPPELEYYLSFVARTGDPVYQWPLIKCLFREKLIKVITEFYEACPSIEIPPCPNVEIFNYEAMKSFILEKLDTFAAAPFTIQRICELLTSPRKEYYRVDKYMRALEKNILVVSTREPGNRKSTENGESVLNGLESEHGSQEMVNSMNSDINVEVDMDEKTVWHKSYAVNEPPTILKSPAAESIQESYVSESKTTESVITAARQINYIGYASDMIAESSTTISNSEDAAPPLPDEASQVFSLSLGRPSETDTQTDKDKNKEKEKDKEEHIYVTEDTATYIKADCSDMETNEIMSETETEPITPPEPEPEKLDIEQVESSIVEAESSSQVEPPTIVPIAPESSNETTISSSDETPQSSSEASEQKPIDDEEISASDHDHQEVTESNIVIGPEDMQVEDISPEPALCENTTQPLEAETAGSVETVSASEIVETTTSEIETEAKCEVTSECAEDALEGNSSKKEEEAREEPETTTPTTTTTTAAAAEEAAESN